MQDLLQSILCISHIFQLCILQVFSFQYKLSSEIYNKKFLYTFFTSCISLVVKSALLVKTLQAEPVKNITVSLSFKLTVWHSKSALSYQYFVISNNERFFTPREKQCTQRNMSHRRVEKQQVYMTLITQPAMHIKKIISFILLIIPLLPFVFILIDNQRI